MPVSLRRRSNPISASTADNQHFIIILTNHPDILRDHTVFRIQINDPTSQLQNGNAHMNHYIDMNDRENVLLNLLRLDLNEVVQDYLLRTRLSLPIHLILEASNIEQH